MRINCKNQLKMSEMDQQFSLSWNNFHGNLTRGFAGLLGKAEFVDVTLAVDGHLLQAHKVILSICSPYFKRMFQVNPCQHPIVVLRDVTHKAMKDLLQFMYHGEVSVKREDLTSFIGTAEVLQIKGLTNKETDGENSDQDTTSETMDKTPQKPVFTSKPTDRSEQTITDRSEQTITDNTHNDDVQKQRYLLTKLQRLNNLKRKSDDYLNSFYSNQDKKPKCKENNKTNDISNDVPINFSNDKVNQEDFDNCQDYDRNGQDYDKKCQDYDSGNDLKTECDDCDIIVTDPAIKDGKTLNDRKETTHEDYEEINALAELKSLFFRQDYITPKQLTTDTLTYKPQDLHNVNMTLQKEAKIRAKSMSELASQDFSHLDHILEVTNRMSGRNYEDNFAPDPHRLTTIPQKEDGKKKYPQRSCRLCWKTGKRRDTRFMCQKCEMPLCKIPCFELHINHILTKFKSNASENEFA